LKPVVLTRQLSENRDFLTKLLYNKLYNYDHLALFYVDLCNIRNAGVRCSSHLSGTIFPDALDFPAHAEMRVASGLGLEAAPVAAVVFSA
jgi:hypothetical protein